MKKVFIFTLLCIVSIFGYSSSFFVERGWNQISSPLLDLEYDFFETCPNLILPLYYYDVSTKGYLVADSSTIDTLLPGVGYWVLSEETQRIFFSGNPDTCIDYELYSSWNMPGAPKGFMTVSDFKSEFTDSSDILSIYRFDPDERRYYPPILIKECESYFIECSDTVSATCVQGITPGSSLWTVEIDSAAQYYRNISSPSLDEEGNVYFSEHLDMNYAAGVSDDTCEYYAIYKLNSTGTILWNVRRDDNAHFKHNPTPVIDIDRETVYCASGPFCISHSIETGIAIWSTAVMGQGHYVGETAIGCEHRYLCRFNQAPGDGGVHTSSRMELYSNISTTLLDTFPTTFFGVDTNFRIVTGSVIDHKGRVFIGADKIDYGNDSIHSTPSLIISLNENSDSLEFVDTNEAGTFAKYSSFALDTNSSGNTRIFAGSMDGLVYAFLDEGDSLHKLFEIVLGGTINSNPVINSDGIIYIGSADANTLQNGRLWALDIDSLITLGGTLDTSYAIWHYPDSGFLEGGIYGSPTIGDDGVIYFGETEGEGYLYAISDHGDSAHFEWRYRRDSLDNIRCCPIVSKDGIVYYTSKTYDEPKFYLNCEVTFA